MVLSPDNLAVFDHRNFGYRGRTYRTATDGARSFETAPLTHLEAIHISL
jgi:hypothetical protein